MRRTIPNEMEMCKMKLRPLVQTDAPYMLEWMHDPDVVRDLHTNFAAKTLDDCKRFIEASHASGSAVNLAIADEQTDEYLGTVSLRDINPHSSTAEFAITVRKCAMGTGASRDAMREILRRGHIGLGIKSIFWCVNQKNARAVRFYDKNNYQRVTNVPETLRAAYPPMLLPELIWYCDTE